MLERVQAERGDRRGVGMAEDAEHAAFLAQAVGVKIETSRRKSHRLSSALRRGYRAVAALSISCRMPSRSVRRNRQLGSERRAAGRVAEVGPLIRRRRIGRVLIFAAFGRFSLFKMVLSGSSGNMDFSHPRCFAARPCDLALRTQAGWLRSRHQPVEKQEGDDDDDQAAAEAEQEAERAVERADPAVEDHVGDPHGQDRDDQQRARKTPPTTAAAATMSLLKYCFAIGSSLAIGVERGERGDRPRRRSTGSRA